MGYFQVRYNSTVVIYIYGAFIRLTTENCLQHDSRVINSDRKTFIRLATAVVVVVGVDGSPDFRPAALSCAGTSPSRSSFEPAFQCRWPSSLGLRASDSDRGSSGPEGPSGSWSRARLSSSPLSFDAVAARAASENLNHFWVDNSRPLFCWSCQYSFFTRSSLAACSRIWSFQTNITYNKCKRCLDSNPWLPEHESPPIITGPGLPPNLAKKIELHQDSVGNHTYRDFTIVIYGAGNAI